MLYISNIDNYSFAMSSVSADAADIESVFPKVYYALSVSKAKDSDTNLVTIQNKENKTNLVSGKDITDITLLGTGYTTKESFCAAFNALMATADGGALTDGSQETQLVDSEGNEIDFEEILIKTGRGTSHGQITDLTSAFKLDGDIPFSLFISPIAEGTADGDTSAVVDCTLRDDTANGDCPFTCNVWDVPYVVEIEASGIDLTVYNVYWSAGQAATPYVATTTVAPTTTEEATTTI